MLETHSHSIESLVLTLAMRQPAAPTPETRIGTLNLQGGVDQSGRLRLQGI